MCLLRFLVLIYKYTCRNKEIGGIIDKVIIIEKHDSKYIAYIHNIN